MEQYIEVSKHLSNLDARMESLEECTRDLKGVYNTFTEAITELVTLQKVIQERQSKSEETQKEIADKVTQLASIVAVMQERQDMSIKGEAALRNEVSNIRAAINHESKKNSIDIRDIAKKVIVYLIVGLVSAGFALLLKGGQ